MAIEGIAVETVPGRACAHAARWLKEPRGLILTVNNVFRLIVLGALAVFLLYYVGPRDIAGDDGQGHLRRRPDGGAVGGGQRPVRPDLRPLDASTRCSGVVIGAVGFFVAEANGALNTLTDHRFNLPGRACSTTSRLDDSALRHQRPALGRCSAAPPSVFGDVPAQRAAPGWRLLLAVVGWTAFGVLPALALRRCRSGRPSTGASCRSPPAPGAVVFGLIAPWRFGAGARSPLTAISGPPSAGMVRGRRAGAVPTSAPATAPELFLVHQWCPRRSSPAGSSGPATEPDRTKRRRIDQRSCARGSS